MQDPAEHDNIDEVIIAERNQMQQTRSVDHRSRTSSDESDPLPSIPDMPTLRPEGANAQLVFITRQVPFTNNQTPLKDNVISALVKKYGEPSVQVEPRPDCILLEWVFDVSGYRIADAAGGPCDHISQEPSAMKEKKKFYSVALTAGRSGQIFNLVTYSPQCGLIVKAQIDAENNGSVRQVSTTVYDAQRLFGDEWFRTSQLEKAWIDQQKAKSNAIESRDVPDF